MLTCQYILWTDKTARELIKNEYSWFLTVYDSYPYNIQRADAMRYFILHKYGGIYMDLDIGCARPMNPLLRFEAILPLTIPVGVSNDLILATKEHPFLELMIHSLKSFNHRFITPYATVMFSTGPMFVSMLYHKIRSSKNVRPSAPDALGAGFNGVRILPKSLYGKNLQEHEAPNSFYRHYYGSSWHAGDAGFLIFLRKYGYWLIAVVLIALMLFHLYFIRRVDVFTLFNISRDFCARYSVTVRKNGDIIRRHLQHLIGGIREPFHEGTDVPLVSVPSNWEPEDDERNQYESTHSERQLSADRRLRTHGDNVVNGRDESLPAYYIGTDGTYEHGV